MIIFGAMLSPKVNLGRYGCFIYTRIGRFKPLRRDPSVFNWISLRLMFCAGSTIFFGPLEWLDIFLTTFYGLYFSHSYAHILHIFTNHEGPSVWAAILQFELWHRVSSTERLIHNTWQRFEPTVVEGRLLSVHNSTNKPPRLDKHDLLKNVLHGNDSIFPTQLNYIIQRKY